MAIKVFHLVRKQLHVLTNLKGVLVNKDFRNIWRSITQEFNFRFQWYWYWRRIGGKEGSIEEAEVRSYNPTMLWKEFQNNMLKLRKKTLLRRKCLTMFKWNSKCQLTDSMLRWSVQCLKRNLDTVKIFKRLMELREYRGIGMIVDDNEARMKCMQMNKRKNTKMELVISDYGITAN